MVIVVVTALAAIVASVYVMVTPKKYAASSTLFVSTPTSDSGNNVYQGAQYSQLRVQSYVEMVNGDQLAQQVIDELHLNMSASQLSSEISASNKNNTVLLNITVKDRSPNQALRINQAVVSTLIETIQQIETPPGAKVPLIKVTAVDPAQFSSDPVSPKPGLAIGLGILVGLLLGFGLAVARELLDSSVKDLSDVHGLSDVPVIAALPLDTTVSSEPLISGLDRQSPRAEAFRVLRTNLQFLSVDSESKVYVVSSSIPGEGKSTTVTNLAIALAQAGKNVLLVDGDLRRPRVASLLGLVSNVGLTTGLVGDMPVADCIQVHNDSGLRVLTSGKVPPNPAELLQTQAMADLLAQLRKRFDVVLIDAPPLLPVTDAALLGSEADGVLLMVRHGKTTKDQLQGAVHRLESVGATLAGVVFNMVPRRAGGGSSAYAYGYGYGYTSDPQRDKNDNRRRSVKKAEAAAFQAKAMALTESTAVESAPVSYEEPAKLDVTWPDAPLGSSTASADEIAERDRQLAAIAERERENAELLKQDLAQRAPWKVEEPPASDSAERTASSDRRGGSHSDGLLSRRRDRDRPTL